MNITEYFTEEENDNSFYRSRMTLRADHTIVDADEPCYRYLGKLSALTLPALAHPEEADCVREALEKVKDGPQRLIFRMMGGNNRYRSIYAVLTQSHRVLNGLHCIDVELLDIMRTYDKFDSEHAKIKKYRKLMTLSDKMYFEYSYESGAITIFEYINDRSIVHCQESFAKIQERVLGNKDYSFSQRAEVEALRECIDSYAENMDLDIEGSVFGLPEGRLNLKGGIAYWSKAKQMMVAVVTVVERMETEEKYYMSQHAFDSATGIYNKRAISELANDLMENATGKKIFLCIVDIDDFKVFNDTYGHLVGDEVIAKVAEVLKSTLGNRGYVGRFGGDEFLVVADKMADSDELICALKAIRKNIAWGCSEKLVDMNVTTSIGIACYPEDASNYEELFEVADKCLYLAKAKGKNRFILYLPELKETLESVTVSAKTPGAAPKQNFHTRSSRAVVDIMGNGGEDNQESFDHCVNKLLLSYDVDRIAIYAGEGYQKVYDAGKYEKTVSEFSLLNDPQVAELFDENGVYIKNKILFLKAIHTGLYELLESQGTEGFIIVKIQMEGCPPAAVIFDTFRRNRKWSSEDQGMLYIAAQLIARRYFRLNKIGNCLITEKRRGE